MEQDAAKAAKTADAADVRCLRENVYARTVQVQGKIQFLQRGVRLGGTWGSCDGPGGARADPDYTINPGIPGNAARSRADISCREIQIQDKPDGLRRRGGRQTRMCEGGRMQGNLGLTPVQAPCKGCADRHTGCHTDCTRYIAFRREADRYKQEQSKDAARYATTRGCMRTLHDANRAKREGRQHY